MSKLLHRTHPIAAVLIFSAAIFLILWGLSGINNGDNKMIVDYATNLGWEINPSPVEISHLTIPTDFDAVYTTYNALQKATGFDLAPFRGKKVVRYTYRVINHESCTDCRVYLGVLVYESRIIAAEISSTDMTGFMHGICETEKII